MAHSRALAVAALVFVLFAQSGILVASPAAGGFTDDHSAMPTGGASLERHTPLGQTQSRHSSPGIPNLLWSRTYGHPLLNESVSGLIETSQGGFVLYGSASRNGMPVPWLLATDSAGTPIWNQTYLLPTEGRATALVEVSTGGYALTGVCYEAYLWFLWASTWLLRIDANGVLQWSSELRTRPEGSPPLGILPYSVVEVGSGDFLVLGLIHRYSEDIHPWLVYVNSSGATLWNQTISSPSMPEAFPIGMVRSRAGDYALAAIAYNQVQGRSGLWFARANESGSLLWNKTLDIQVGLFSLQECADGGFVLAGSISAYNETTGEDKATATLVRLDAAANLLWNETYHSVNDNWAEGAVERGTQYYAIAGTTRILGTEDSNVWIAFADTDGRLLHNYAYGGPGESFGRAIVACAGGGYAVAGRFDYSTAEGSGTADALLLRLAEPDLTPPAWRTPPTTQLIAYGLPFVYGLAAEDALGLDTWWLRDTSFFMIDQAGLVSSIVSLALGAYTVTVCVNDTSGNILEGSFTVLVVPSVLIIPGFPWTVLEVIVIIVLVIPWRCHRSRNGDR